MMKFRLIALGSAAVAAFAVSASLSASDETAAVQPAGGSGQEVDEALPAYKPVNEKLAGTLNAVGSDTMINIVTNWGEAFGKQRGVRYSTRMYMSSMRTVSLGAEPGV